MTREELHKKWIEKKTKEHKQILLEIEEEEKEKKRLLNKLVGYHGELYNTGREENEIIIDIYSILCELIKPLSEDDDIKLKHLLVELSLGSPSGGWVTRDSIQNVRFPSSQEKRTLNEDEINQKIINALEVLREYTTPEYKILLRSGYRIETRDRYKKTTEREYQAKRAKEIKYKIQSFGFSIRETGTIYKALNEMW